MGKTCIAVLLCLVGISAAIASDFYEGVKAGGVRYDYSNVARNNQVGMGYLLGYSFNRNLAVEIEYNLLGGFETSTRRYKGYATAVNAVATVPLNKRFSLFGKLGLANTGLNDYAKSGPGGNTTYNNTSITGGFGVQFNITGTVGLRAEYDVYKVGDSRSGTGLASMYSAGGVFRF